MFRARITGARRYGDIRGKSPGIDKALRIARWESDGRDCSTTVSTRSQSCHFGPSEFHDHHPIRGVVRVLSAYQVGEQAG